VLLVVALVVTGAFPVRADVAQRGLSASLVDELLHETAVGAELEALALQRSVHAVLSSKLDAIPRDLTVLLRRTLQRDLASDSLGLRFRSLVAARTHKGHVRRLLDFYRSPLGRRYARADRRPRPGVSRPDDRRLTPARTRLLDQWLEASWTLRRFELEVVVPAAGLARTVAALSGARAPSAEELAAPMRSTELRAAVLQTFAHAFHDFTDADLTLLVRAERSPAGQWYRRVENDAMTQTLEEAFRALEIEAQGVRERVRQRAGR